MNAGIGRSLRAASIHLLAPVLLACAASSPLHASPLVHPEHPTPALAAEVQTAQSRIPITRIHPRDAACVRLALNAPSNSIAPGSARRIFVEDTTPPSSGSLKAQRIRLVPAPQTRPPAASPAFRSASFSHSNRQRAP